MTQNTPKNYHGFFTYESISPGNGVDRNLSYHNCVMLKDIGAMKKGMKILDIAISYDIYGFLKGGEIQDFDYAATTVDYSDKE